MKLIALIKKEFHRFFHDPRLIVSILLPGVVIFVIYSLLGSVISSEEESYRFKVYKSGDSALVAVIERAITESGSSVEWLEGDAEEGKDALLREEADGVLVFSEGFDLMPLGGSVEVWYNATSDRSVAFQTLASGVLQASAMRFSVLSRSVGEESLPRMVLANILPFLLVTFIFSSCMSVTLESIAGEKERGTLSTILATSVKRSHIALGKILPLSCISMLGAASGFFGVVLSLPRLMGADFGIYAEYPFFSYVLILLLVIGIVPLIVSVIAAISTLARSVKEASGYVGVVMILVMVVSLISVFVTELGEWSLAVPVLNAVVVIGKLLGGELAVWQSFVAVGVNLLCSALLVWLIAKMLSSERVMFGK